ncbi:hypothetical protein HI113_44545, partial [Corallococcus exiguus]|uniref:glycerophosphodiester phosphodiesterase n=1 Tax=Corallococcus exiguus TaxID=83462 RepID=UPI00182775A0
DMIESDARLSSDGVVFALHDADLARIAKNPITVAATGSERLRAVRLEGGERLATLSSVLSECGRLCPVLVDVKRSDAAIIRAILDTIKRIGHRHEVWIGVRDIEQCKLLSTAAPSIPVLAFLQNYEDAPAFERAGAQAHRVWEGDLGAPTVPTLFGR